MSQAAREKRSKSRPDAGPGFPGRKEEGIQLHDEADLINFRADALARFINNQDYMENVTLKPFHASQIAPPLSFPVHSKNKYKESATTEDLEKLLRELKPDELYFGDLRLMKVKEQVLAQELATLKKERAEQSADSVFSEETRFQSNAVQKLAKLHAACNNIESLEELEKGLEEVVEENNTKFHKNYVLQKAPYKKFSIPISEISSDLKVQTAPQLYNPRLIMSFMGMNDEPNGMQFNSENMMLDTSKLGAPYNGGEDFTAIMEKSVPTVNGQNAPGTFGSNTPYNGSYNAVPSYNANRYTNNSENYMQINEFLEPTRPSPRTGQTSNEPNLEADMNMDDLNQLLAESNGNDDIVGDDMDALMNFDQDNEPGAGMMGDAFNDDFLSQIDNGME